MDTNIAAIFEAVTADWRGKVRKSSAEVRRFENHLVGMNKTKGLRVRVPTKNAGAGITAASEITNVVKAAMAEELQVVLEKAIEKTPTRTGNLQASGKVVPPKRDGATLVGRVEFGDERANYAIYVHERVELKHPTGQAKFLEAAAVENQRGMHVRMAMAVREYLRRL